MSRLCHFILLITLLFTYNSLAQSFQGDINRRRQSCIQAVSHFKNRPDDSRKRELQSECEANCGGVNTWEIGQLQPYAFQCNDSATPYKCGNKAMCRIAVMNILVDCKKSPLPSFCKSADEMASACVSACSPQYSNSCNDYDLRDFQQGQSLCHQQNVKMSELIPDEVAKTVLLNRNKVMIIETDGRAPTQPQFYMSMFYQTIPDESISTNVLLGTDDIPRTAVDSIGGRYAVSIPGEGCSWKADVISRTLSSGAVVVNRYANDCKQGASNGNDNDGGIGGKKATNGEAVGGQQDGDLRKLGLYDRVDADSLAKRSKYTMSLVNEANKNPYIVQQIRGPASIKTKKKKAQYFPADHTHTNDHIHRKDRNIFGEVKRQYDNLDLDAFGEIIP